MKKLICMAIMGTVLMTACSSSVGLGVGTSIVPGVYIGGSTSTSLKKSDLKKTKKTEKKKSEKYNQNKN